MDRRRSIRWPAVALAFLVAGCSGTAATPSGPSSASASPIAAATPTQAATAMPTPEEQGPPSQMAVRVVSPANGASVGVAPDSTGRNIVAVSVEVTGAPPMIVTLTVNGLPAVDAGGHPLESVNKDGKVPYQAAFPWSPANGGGEYDLVVTALDDQKMSVTATIHLTVTAIPHVTPPPAATEAQARTKFVDLLRKDYGITIPRPSLHRFDSPIDPTRSRWIGAVYYKGTRYYAQMFDDGRVDVLHDPYADPAHRTSATYLCRPAGTFKVLVVFVDYGNTGTTRDAAFAQVPVVVDWLNGMYDRFATSQGFASAVMHVSADPAWIAAPPVPNKLLTVDQVRSLAGKDPAQYDFLMQIDLDTAGGYGVHESPGIMNPGGGFAMNGCETDAKLGPVNVWSSVTAASSVRGGLVMDFNHELSHLFGMMDDWPFIQNAPGPEGSTVDDWIPYAMFGWTDTDGDGVPEIVDSTPYGTTGPKP